MPFCCSRRRPRRQTGDDRPMAIMTVNGPIEADQLGLTLAHEHIFCDTSGDYREPPANIESLMAAMGVDLEDDITLPGLGFLWREPQWSVSNQILESYEDAVDELRWARRAGVTAVLDSPPPRRGQEAGAARRPRVDVRPRVIPAARRPLRQ